MIGKHRDTADIRLMRLEAAADQILAYVKDQTARHAGNRDLVDVCLDIHNELSRALARRGGE